MSIRPPHGFEQIVKGFGDPRNYIGADAVMSDSEALQWKMSLNLVHVSFPAPIQISFGRPGQLAHSMLCHPFAADAFRAVFHELALCGLWPELKTFGGCFNVRQQRGSADKWSLHSWGLAVDFDVINNPLGAKPRMDIRIVQAFELHGFSWGGWWRRPDGQHFQYATGY